MADDPLARVGAAADGLRVAQRTLEEAVAEARVAGCSWAEVGRVLGVSRQAAFKRFGAARDPRTGGTMTGTRATDVRALTEELFARIDRGDYDALRERMPDDVATVLTRDLVLDTWARAVAETGNLVRCSASHVELPDGTVVADDEPVLGAVVGVTTLECEAGSWLGRVALDGDRRVLGLLVVPPGTTDLPF